MGKKLTEEVAEEKNLQRLIVEYGASWCLKNLAYWARLDLENMEPSERENKRQELLKKYSPAVKVWSPETPVYDEFEIALKWFFIDILRLVPHDSLKIIAEEIEGFTSMYERQRPPEDPYAKLKHSA